MCIFVTLSQGKPFSVYVPEEFRGLDLLQIRTDLPVTSAIFIASFIWYLIIRCEFLICFTFFLFFFCYKISAACLFPSHPTAWWPLQRKLPAPFHVIKTALEKMNAKDHQHSGIARQNNIPRILLYDNLEYKRSGRRKNNGTAASTRMEARKRFVQKK